MGNAVDDFAEILESLPQKPARSCLERYGALIDELLKRDWTYRGIARILADKCDVHVSISTIHHIFGYPFMLSSQQCCFMR